MDSNDATRKLDAQIALSLREATTVDEQNKEEEDFDLFGRFLRVSLAGYNWEAFWEQRTQCTNLFMPDTRYWKIVRYNVAHALRAWPRVSDPILQHPDYKWDHPPHMHLLQWSIRKTVVFHFFDCHAELEDVAGGGHVVLQHLTRQIKRYLDGIREAHEAYLASSNPIPLGPWGPWIQTPNRQYHSFDHIRTPNAPPELARREDFMVAMKELMTNAPWAHRYAIIFYLRDESKYVSKLEARYYYQLWMDCIGEFQQHSKLLKFLWAGCIPREVGELLPDDQARIVREF